MMITKTTYKALKALSKGTYQRGISAKALAWTLWGEDPRYEYLFTASSNQGNGATCGKKAWLCAGSLLGKLARRGLAGHDKEFRGYYLTLKGEEALKEYETQKKGKC